ncbi:hypothetical protein [Mycobacterium talmoniae]|uniref:Uncharacterized protein n=1 Tax=Mycobacterium talmoniae TaxID=1858794 RepID=A0A1S1MU46_9MYCO|nr:MULTISPECIES: hypothetical protein [Mycobacterium]OHU92282.1 hypothetical protein BKN37_25305 [Mycobacterium talmoniae]PQM44847.1 hypothetical protein C1Y40_04997 [Mycobacterium talmoniae]TDH46452.1 hypothetical protein E2F47_27200 [Mycobacterium eburneum]
MTVGGDDLVFHNFSEAHEGLDHIKRVIDNVSELTDTVRQVFQVDLPEGFKGTTGTEITAAHHEIDSCLQDIIHELSAIQVDGVQQQDDMAALDRGLAQGIRG